MSHWPLVTTFLIASLVLAATPGPGVLYIVTRTLAQGRGAGLASVAGVALGNLGNSLAASLGLAALLAVSSLAFTLLKLAGAAYLVWLGIQALRAPSPSAVSSALAVPRQRRILRDGVVVALLNPKTALFFVAFLPQFVDPSASIVWQSVLFGVAFVAIAACTDTAYVFTAALVAPWLSQASRWRPAGRLATSSVYLGLGLMTALSSPRITR
jgi:threonine/homoserine/homoserine lactone efflux protein